MTISYEVKVQKTVKEIASGIRRRVLEHTIKNNGGYLSQACSSAEIFAALYTGVMKLNPVARPIKPGPFCGTPSAANNAYSPGYLFNGAHTPESDRFILSPTHYSLVLYAALIETGRMDASGLDDFNKDGSSVEMIGAEHSPGMEVMTGSLGQGLSQAIGMALGRRMKGETGRTWVFMSDGEFQIGMVWEAFQFMSHYKMDNIGIYVDVNKQQCDGSMDTVMCIDPLEDRLKAFGAIVRRVYGHNTDELAAVSRTKSPGKPLVVLAETCPWQGIDILKSNAPKLHYVRFRNEEEKMMYEDFLRKMA